MNGVIIVNKPEDWTSFDVVAKIRNLSRVAKVGHSGTLDPMATGVLPVFLGRATKSIDRFLNGNKGYLAEMTLGATSDTGDATGKLRMTNVPLDVARGQMTNDGIKQIFEKYIGEIEQVPPMYSAKKINGKRLYELARQGIEVKREPRKVTIFALRITDDVSPDPSSRRITFYVECSKGTYIRQLAQDIGDDLGCGAYLSKLQRTYAQPFHISQAINMETIITLAGANILASIVIPVEELFHE
jgi:tRNA pseudouridine55 synthase